MAAKSRQKERAAEEATLKTISGLVTEDVDRIEQRLLNDRVRLGVLSCLAVAESLTFSELKKLLDVTDGNLSVHARKLEDGRLISCSKSFVSRVPKTTFAITDQGKKALDRHLKHMEALIKATSR